MSNPCTVNESVWMTSSWHSPLVRFNFDKIGAAYTTAILAGAMAVWIGVAYILGTYLSTEWFLFIAIAAWLVGLSLTIFPDLKTEKIILLVVLLPPIALTFAINYIPLDGVVYYIGIGVGVLVFFAYVYYWFRNLLNELKEESTLIFI